MAPDARRLVARAAGSPACQYFLLVGVRPAASARECADDHSDGDVGSQSFPGQVSHYEVCIGTASRSCNIRLANVGANQTSFVFAPPPGQMVYVAVRAVNSKGRSSLFDGTDLLDPLAQWADQS